MSLKIGIIGLGIGGAAAAAAMTRRGLDVTVFEQAAEIREVGAGIATWPNSVRLLRRLGLGKILHEIGWPVGNNPIRDSSGTILHYVPSASSYDDTLGYYVHRAELLATIISIVEPHRVRLGSRCIGLEQNGWEVSVHLENGERHAFDVVIGADGIHSVAIDAVVVGGPPVYSNLAAYRGLVSNDGNERLEAGTLWTDRKKYFVAFPISGGRLVNFVGVVPTEGLPEESWFKTGSKEALSREYAGWDPVLRRIIDKVGETFRWGLYFRNPLPRIVNGRVALLGDAAHPMLINAGQGAGQALEDGFALAVLLDGATRETVEDRLELYGRLRLGRATEVQQLSLRNAQFMHEAMVLSPGETRPDRMSPVDWIVNYDVEREAEAILGIGHTPPNHEVSGMR
ncbi:MAG TPA: FAD-dependent monooxygenase [Gemmataceae bacterium]|nr:FAD-dependent monooxygenase [Gemmataceae bacterium]